MNQFSYIEVNNLLEKLNAFMMDFLIGILYGKNEHGFSLFGLHNLVVFY